MASTFLNANANLHANGNATPSGAQTVNAGGSNVVAICCISFNTTGFVSIAASYASQSMTAVPGSPANSNPDFYVALFYLVNPPTGSNTLAVTLTSASSHDIYYDLTAVQGVDQTTPIRPNSFTSAVGPSAAPSNAIPSAVGDLVIGAMGWASGAATSPTLTQINQDRIGTDVNFLDAYGPGAATVTDSWVISNQDWVMAGCSLQAAAGGAPIVQRSTLKRIFS